MTNYDPNLLAKFRRKPADSIGLKDVKRAVDTLKAQREPWERSLAQRKADAPLRPKAPQQPRHELGGLFGDMHNQLDMIEAIVDIIRKGPKP